MKGHLDFLTVQTMCKQFALNYVQTNSLPKQKIWMLKGGLFFPK